MGDKINIPNNDNPVNIKRDYQINPETALTNVTDEFTNLVGNVTSEANLKAAGTQITNGLLNATENIIKKQILDAVLINPASQEYQDTENAYLEGLEGLNLGLSDLNLPIWDYIILQGIDDATREPITFTFNIALIDITQTKNIVKTAVAGRNGTVKEYISDGDYQINIKAQIVHNAPDTYPINEIKNLKKILNVNIKTLSVYSKIINNLGINECIVDSYTIAQSEAGMRNVQNVELNLLSDKTDDYAVYFLGFTQTTNQ